MKSEELVPAAHYRYSREDRELSLLEQELAAKALPVPKRFRNALVFIVRCGDELHRIVYHKKKLIPIDHDWRAERQMMMLGAKPTEGCMHIMVDWDDGAFNCGDGVHGIRYTAKHHAYWPLARQTHWFDKWADKISTTVQDSLRRCDYTRSGCGKGRPFEQQVSVGVLVHSQHTRASKGSLSNQYLKHGVHITGGWMSPNSRIRTFINATVRYGWYHNIYLKGLDVVSGNLILAIPHKDDKYYYVIAGKQGKGASIRTRHAVVYRNRKMLVWRSWRVDTDGKIRLARASNKQALPRRPVRTGDHACMAG